MCVLLVNCVCACRVLRALLCPPHPPSFTPPRYVTEALRAGAAPFVPKEQRATHAGAYGGHSDKSSNLRFEAYEPAPSQPPPSSRGGASTGSTPSHALTGAHAGSDPFADFGASTSAAPNHSRNASAGSASGAAPSGPQLRGAAVGKGRWGPAQFEAPAPAPSASAASASSRPGQAGGAGSITDLLGGPAPTAQGQQPSVPGSSGPSASAAPPKPMSERDRLTASLFGPPQPSGSGKPPVLPAPRPASASAKLAPPPPAPAPPKQPDLLDLLNSPLPGHNGVQQPSAAAQPAAMNPMDLLMDFDLSSAPAPLPFTSQLQPPAMQLATSSFTAAPPQPPLGGLDALFGGMPFGQAPTMQSASPSFSQPVVAPMGAVGAVGGKQGGVLGGLGAPVAGMGSTAQQLGGMRAQQAGMRGPAKPAPQDLFSDLL